MLIINNNAEKFELILIFGEYHRHTMIIAAIGHNERMIDNRYPKW